MTFDPFAPFIAPTEEPQLELETSSTLSQLMYDAPPWDPEIHALELAHLFRTHVVLRSAIQYVLRLAGKYDNQLKLENEPREIYRIQGKYQAAMEFVTILMTHMEEAETPEDEEE